MRPSTDPAALDIFIPEELPFLKSLSWSDRGYGGLSPLEMLRRYESGWRHLGVLADRVRGAAARRDPERV